MARVLGLRAEARQFFWAVLEGTQDAPLVAAQDKAIAPAGADEASALAWFRGRARHLFEAYKPDAVMLRTPEFSARAGNTDGARRRLRVEGVLLEVSHAAGLKVSAGALVTISSNLGTRSAKKYLEAGEVRGLDISKQATPAKEAILVAISGLPKA